MPPDNALHALGFEFTRITGDEVLGRLTVTEICCQVRTLPPCRTMCAVIGLLN
jgi:hypothetical protein